MDQGIGRYMAAEIRFLRNTEESKNERTRTHQLETILNAVGSKLTKNRIRWYGHIL
jgi:hypothetical protein